MRLRILRRCRLNDGSTAIPGDVVEVTRDVGSRLCSSNKAEAIYPEEPPRGAPSAETAAKSPPETAAKPPATASGSSRSSSGKVSSSGG